MTPERFLKTAIEPACAELAPAGVVDSALARRFMLAIALQESGLRHRRQLSSDGTESGPASGFFQFERGGGCTGVVTHRGVAPIARALLALYDVEPTTAAIWTAIQYQDIVAAACARLLIHTLPQKLPATADEGWTQYLDAWRPGKPHLENWAGHWATASAVVGI